MSTLPNPSQPLTCACGQLSAVARGLCPACEPREERHEALPLFAPAPAVMPGQTGLEL
jgi:hypothetical protein